MQKINTVSDLKGAILLLEAKQAEEAQLLKAQFHLTTESVKPINLIKSAFKQVTGLEETKGDIVSSSVGLATGFFSKMLFERFSHNPVKKLIGTALLLGVNNVIAKNPGAIRAVGNFIFSKIRGKRKAVSPLIYNHENSTIYNKENLAEI